MKLRSKEKDPEDHSTFGVASCFFCLQDSGELTLDIHNQTEPFSLRHHSRFLKIFENDEEEEKLSDGLKRKLFTLANESNVFICQDCSKMMEEFKELYHLMEVTKLRMNWCVQKMNDVMVLAKSKEKSRVSENGMQLGGVTLVEILRDKTIDKMNKITSTSSTSKPRVIIRQARLPRTTTFHANITEKAPTVTTRSKSNGKVSMKSSPTKLNISNKTSAKRLTIGSNISKLNDERRKRKFNNANVDNRFPSTTSLECSQCRANFKYFHSSGSRSRLRRHIVTYHCEQYFPIENHKLDHVTVPEYKKILSDILFKDFISGGEEECCPFCEKKYSLLSYKKSESISAIKLHLAELHSSQVKEKLLQIQKDPSLPTMLENGNPKGKFCRCGVYLPNLRSQSQHEQFHCVLTKERMPVKVVAGQSNFTTIPSRPDRTCCKLCNCKIINGRPHRMYTCLKSLRRCRTQNQARMDADGNKIPHSCPYCRSQFSGDYHTTLWNRHLLSFHPEHFFLDLWEEESTSGTLTKDQFQRIIWNLLLPEFVSKNKPFNCQLLCETRFGRKLDLKNHLMRSHKSEMKDRLRMILRDANLQEKLESFNGQGMYCPCGMYVPSSQAYQNKASRQAYHYKNHCKLKTGAGSNKTLGVPIALIEDEFNGESQLKINSSYSLSNVEASKGKAEVPIKNKDNEEGKPFRKRKKIIATISEDESNSSLRKEETQPHSAIPTKGLMCSISIRNKSVHEKLHCNLRTEAEEMEVVDKDEDAASSEDDIDIKYGSTFEEMDTPSPLSHGEVDIEEVEEPDLLDEDEYIFSELFQTPFNHDEIEGLMKERDLEEVEDSTLVS